MAKGEDIEACDKSDVQEALVVPSGIVRSEDQSGQLDGQHRAEDHACEK
jgi:hypothetical protein